ncbi:hypothetical protein PSQ19_04890 [Devosia algicola]|uniref:Uncharacterized protein n=1 Tax=Devosia algicola TaxID=3026418 RepID=A0ABY7YQ84_9HYPH|nr:hypothetical protein [Devosia algicola]WDR03446.1 hypothetical protein PSQ19_04890 [Devosia algicola]
MAFRKVTRDQFEHMADGRVHHRPLGMFFSASPNTDPIDAEIEHTNEVDANRDKDGYEYDHDEVKREALDMLRDLASGASR